jgi:hypothetical protein
MMGLPACLPFEISVAIYRMAEYQPQRICYAIRHAQSGCSPKQLWFYAL